MSDSSAIDNALLAKLGGDNTLLGHCPNGVYWEVGPPGATKFVVVALMDEADVRQFGSPRAYEDALFLVKAVMLSTASGNIQAAAARIDALLDNGDLTVNGYTLAALYRESRVHHTEIDDIDPSIRWYHRGGLYRLVMAGSP